MDKEVCSVVLQRWEVIDSLGEGAKDKRTLVENLDCSRSTVNRAVRELESMGLVEYVDGEYEVTALGETITVGFKEMMNTVELQLELEPFLQWMPEDEFDLDLHLLDDAELVLSEAGDPYRVINRHIKRLKTMDEGYFLIPYTGLHAAETAYERIVHQGAQCEIIVSPAVIDTFKTNPNYTEAIKEMTATGGLDIFQASTEIPFSLGVIDDRVQIIADEDEEPRALVEIDNPIVRNWAENTFKEYKQQTEPVEIAPEPTKARS